MTASDRSKLSRRIDMELSNIEQAVVRTQMGWEQYKSSGDDLLVDSVASSLHGFYNGV